MTDNKKTSIKRRTNNNQTQTPKQSHPIEKDLPLPDEKDFVWNEIQLSDQTENKTTTPSKKLSSQFSEFRADVKELVDQMIEKGLCANEESACFAQLEECNKWDEAMFWNMWLMVSRSPSIADDPRLPPEKMNNLKSDYDRMERFKNAQKPDEIVKKTIETLKTNNGFGQDKFPHQVNVKLTNEDMKRANAINEEYFGGDASASMLIRAFARKGMEWYMKDSESKE